MRRMAPTPVHPPDQDAIDWLRLARSRRVGPATLRRLLRQFGSAGAALEALPEIAAEAGEKSYMPCPPDAALAEYEAGMRMGAHLLLPYERAFPHMLDDLSDAPPLLWAIGALELLERPAIALVGARNASALGLRMTKRLAQELGEQGLTVVSGLARGIDAAAHEAALATGTIAVQAGGIDVAYPRETEDLMHRIGREGLRLSELPPGTAPRPQMFPRRNRIISGLSRAVVVVEAAAKSGSMHTARNALDQGREVMAVPGHPFDARAAGCNMLIRDGALLVRGARDILEALGPLEAPAAPVDAAPADPPQPTLPLVPAQAPAAPDLGARLLGLLSSAPLPEDVLIRETGAPPQQVIALLAELDLMGQITRHPGGLVTRV